MPAKLVNSLAVESPRGSRRFDVVQGDITEGEADLLAISGSAGGDAPVGQVLTAFEACFGYRYGDVRPLLLNRSLAGTWEAMGPAPGRFRKLVVVRIPGADIVEAQGGDTLAVYRDSIWSLFGSLAALEMRGERFETVAMSLLGGSREYPQPAAMRIMMDLALGWLSTSTSARTITLYLFEEREVTIWSRAMDDVLQRSQVDAARSEVIDALRQDILSQATKVHGSQPIDRAVAGLLPILKADEVVLQQVAAFARLLAEAVAFELARDLHQKRQPTLYDTIYAVESSGRVAPWVCSYLHHLRVLGNESVHARDDVDRVPRALEAGDLVAVLSSTLRVMCFWAEWQQHRSSKTNSVAPRGSPGTD